MLGVKWSVNKTVYADFILWFYEKDPWIQILWVSKFYWYLKSAQIATVVGNMFEWMFWPQESHFSQNGQFSLAWRGIRTWAHSVHLLPDLHTECLPSGILPQQDQDKVTPLLLLMATSGHQEREDKVVTQWKGNLKSG